MSGIDTKRLSRMGLLTALALIASYIEAILPISFGIPGVKPGFANIIIVFALYSLKDRDAFMINLARIVLVSAMFGNLSMMLYSLAGGVLSFLAMSLLKRTEKFSIYGVSVAGGVFHNIGQLLMAMAVLETAKLIYYVPVLMIAGLVTGLVIGVVAGEVMKRVGPLVRKK